MAEDGTYAVPGQDDRAETDSFDLDDGASDDPRHDAGSRASGSALDGMVDTPIPVFMPVDLDGDGAADAEYDLGEDLQGAVTGQSIVDGDEAVDGDGFDLDQDAVAATGAAPAGDVTADDDWTPETDDDGGQSLIHPPDPITDDDLAQATQDLDTQTHLQQSMNDAYSSFDMDHDAF